MFLHNWKHFIWNREKSGKIGGFFSFGFIFAYFFSHFFSLLQLLFFFFSVTFSHFKIHFNHFQSLSVTFVANQTKCKLISQHAWFHWVGLFSDTFSGETEDVWPGVVELEWFLVYRLCPASVSQEPQRVWMIIYWMPEVKSGVWSLSVSGGLNVEIRIAILPGCEMQERKEVNFLLLGLHMFK
jgi:hypothetical protein